MMDSKLDQREHEIELTYEALGLGSTEARAQFFQFEQQSRPVEFDVIISTTSQPFTR